MAARTCTLILCRAVAVVASACATKGFVRSLDTQMKSLDARVGEVGTLASAATARPDSATVVAEGAETRLSQRIAGRNRYRAASMGKVAPATGEKPGDEADANARRVDIRLLAPWSSWEDRRPRPTSRPMTRWRRRRQPRRVVRRRLRHLRAAAGFRPTTQTPAWSARRCVRFSAPSRKRTSESASSRRLGASRSRVPFFAGECAAVYFSSLMAPFTLAMSSGVT